MQKFINDVMAGLYSKDYMDRRTLGAKSSNESAKEAVPKADIKTLIGMCDICILLVNYYATFHQNYRHAYVLFLE